MPRRRKIQSPSEVALEIFRHWSDEDINFLRDFLNSLLKPPQPASQELPCGVRGGGFVEKKIINGKSYFYHRYNHGGRRLSVYLGKRHPNEMSAEIEGLAAIRQQVF
jgi:hypothetical protein